MFLFIYFCLQSVIFLQQPITPIKPSLSKHSEAESGTPPPRMVHPFSRFLTLQADAAPEFQTMNVYQNSKLDPHPQHSDKRPEDHAPQSLQDPLGCRWPLIRDGPGHVTLAATLAPELRRAFSAATILNLFLIMEQKPHILMVDQTRNLQQVLPPQTLSRWNLRGACLLGPMAITCSCELLTSVRPAPPQVCKGVIHELRPSGSKV